MAGEIQFSLPGLSGRKLRAVLRNAAGQVYNTATPGFEAWENDNIANYDIALTELDTTSGRWTGDMPALAAGLYTFEVVNPADQDDPVVIATTDPVVGLGSIEWNGSSAVPPSAAAIAAAVDTVLTAAHGSGLWTTSGGGAGANEFVYTLTDGVSGAPVAGANVWVTSGSSDPNTGIVASGVTDDNGQVTFWLDAGTWYLWRARSGYNFTNPDSEVVT